MDDIQAIFCVLCKRPARSMCQRCRDFYCSAQCQILDWPQHKLTCMPMPALIPVPKLDQSHLSQSCGLTSLNQGSQNRTDQKDSKTSQLSKNKKAEQHGQRMYISKDNANGQVKPESFKICITNDLNQTNANEILPQNEIDEKLSDMAAPVGKKNSNIVKAESLKISIINDLAVNSVSDTILAHKENEIVNLQDIQKQLMKNDADQVNDKQINDKSNNDDSRKRPLELPQDKPATGLHVNMTDITKPKIEVEKTLLPQKIPKPELQKETVVKNDTASVVSIPPRMPSNWRKTFPIDEKVVNVIVHYIDEKSPTLMWVIKQSSESCCNKLLREINQSINNNTPPIPCDQIKVNELVAAPLEGIFYRAVVLSNINGEVLVRLLDYGNEFYTKSINIKPPIPVMKNLNAFSFRINLTPNKTVSIGDVMTVNILSEHNIMNGTIYMAQEQVKLFEDIKAAVNDFAEDNVPFTMKHLSVIPFPTEVPAKIQCLDSSSIITGQITACSYDPILIENFAKFSTKLAEYGRKLPNVSFSPDKGELCLAIFQDDGNWYRAVCEHVLSNEMFLLRFVDYGNSIKCSSQNIRKISKEFLHPLMSHTCVITREINEECHDDDVGKIQKYIDESEYFEIDYVQKLEDTYIIRIANLTKIIANQ